MPRRLCTLFTMALSIILLAGCNLPFFQKAAPVPQVETQTPELATLPAAIQVTPEPKTYDPNPDLMVAPADAKIESLPAGVYQVNPPTGFRKLLVYPVGGIEGGSYCETTPVSPLFQQAPTEYQALEKDVWGEKNFVTCGWSKGETITITLIRPDGSTETTSSVFDSDISTTYSPQMQYGMQLGNYTITFEGLSGKISADYKVVWPTEPGMVKVENASSNQYFVYGFQPGEQAYILAYQKSSDALRLSTWRSVTVDQRGELLVDDQFNGDYLVVAGDNSGAVWNSLILGIFVGENMYYKQVEACAGSPTSRLQPFSFAYVTEGTPNNVRSSPSKSADLVGKIDPDTVVIVDRQAPVCADGLLWWRIYPRDENSKSGWTAEGKGSDYWLAPLE